MSDVVDEYDGIERDSRERVTLDIEDEMTVDELAEGSPQETEILRERRGRTI